jgi:hypothetical protein
MKLSEVRDLALSKSVCVICSAQATTRNHEDKPVCDLHADDEEELEIEEPEEEYDYTDSPAFREAVKRGAPLGRFIG